MRRNLAVAAFAATPGSSQPVGAHTVPDRGCRSSNGGSAMQGGLRRQVCALPLQRSSHCAAAAMVCGTCEPVALPPETA